jgi:hypothetical protein
MLDARVVFKKPKCYKKSKNRLPPFNFTRFLELGESFVNLLLGENLLTPGALVNFLCELIIDKVIGKIDRVKPHGKMVDPSKILVPATVAQKIILKYIHPYPSTG